MAGLFAGLFYILLPHHAWYAHAGYEVYMQMAILLYSLWRLDRLRPLDAFILGLLPLTHGTALVMWAMLVAGTLLFRDGSWRRTFHSPAWPSSRSSRTELFRLAYYGESLPNTFWLKAGGGSIRGGAGYAVRWLVTLAPLGVLAAYAVLHVLNPMRWFMTALAVVHAISIVALGGDILPQFRFLLPCSLILAALAGAGASELLGGPLRAHLSDRATAVRAGAVAGLAAIACAVTVYSYWRQAPLFEAQRRWNLRHIATGIALRENTRPDDVVALFGLGFTGYFADRPTIDMLGKADYHIARVPPVKGRFIGHNKTDVPYVLAREPVYVEMNVPAERFADRAWLAKQLSGDGYGYTFDLALSEDFRDEYDVRLRDRKGRRVPFAVRADVEPTTVACSRGLLRQPRPLGPVSGLPMRTLAIIPNDPIDLYLSSGYGAAWLKSYFNPNGFFDKVYSLAPYEQVDGALVGLTVVPTEPAQLDRRLRALNVDVVRAYGGSHACTIATYGKVSGIPVVVSVHDTSPSLLDAAIVNADVVLCVSDAVKRLVASKVHHHDRLWILPNRVDFSVMRPSHTADTSDLDTQYPYRYRILHVGRKTRQKNLDTLIRALAILGPDYCVIAAGKGPVDEYAQLAVTEGVRDRLFFVEAIPNATLPKYFAWAHCLCNPSRWEGMSIVLIEALAAGAIVVASDIPEISESITDHYNGLLIKDFENPTAVAAAVRTACTDSALRSDLSANAQVSAERFDRHAIDALEAGYYQTVLDMSAKGLFRESLVTRAKRTAMRDLRRVLPPRVKDILRPMMARSRGAA